MTRGTLAGATIVRTATRSSRLVRSVLVVVVAAFVVAPFLVVSVVAGPLNVTCESGIATDDCHETVTAALERGLPGLHPIILATRVDPGPAVAPSELGHRATVTFTMLGVPGATRVKLFVDVGGHWGGVPDRGPAELALWSLVVPAVVLAGLCVAWLVGVRIVAAGAPAPTERRP